MSILDRLAVQLAQWRGFHVSESPPGWVKSLSGWSTATGQTVSPSTAMQITAVYACVRILSETIASLPLPVYRRLQNGGKERAPGHPLYAILHDAPNPETTSFELREVLQAHLLTWGNAYAEIEFNGAGQVASLWPLRPDRMKVSRKGGRLQYTYRLPRPDTQGRTEVNLAPEQVLHLRGLGYDGVVGYSPISQARQAVGLAQATEEYGARFFANGARPGIVLRHPGKLSQEAHDRLRESYEKRHQGLENAHRVAVLEEGLDVAEIGLPPQDAQFLETRKFQRNEIAMIYRVPPHMLADLERATFSNIEHQSLEFVMHTVRPWLVRWEQAMQRALFLPSERRRYFAEFLVDGLLRGDIKSRYEAYAVGRQNGWLSANDVRELENQNPIPGGDVYLVPLNMIPAGQAGMEPSLEEAPADERAIDYARTQPDEARAQGYARERHRLALTSLRLYEDVAARVLRREANDVGNAARRWLKQRDVQQFSLWLDEFYRDHIDFVVEQFRPLGMTYGELVAAAARGEVGEPPELNDSLSDWIYNYVDTFAARHVAVSEGRIRSVMRESLEANEEPLTAIEAELEGWPEARAAETARWETFRFNNALAVAVYLGARVQRVRWAAFGDSCPYCSNLDGQIVSIRQFFLSAGEDFQPDGAERPLHVSHNVGHAPAHDGCDCMTVSA